jgi:hypothetical protein
MDPVNHKLARRKSPAARTSRWANTWASHHVAARRLIVPILLLATALSGVATAMRFIDAWLEARPLVGTVLAFDTTLPRTMKDWTRITVRRADDGAAACVMELGALRTSGGSLVVTGRRGEAVSVHWAGPRTAGDAKDCGQDAELVLRRHDLDILADIARDNDPIAIGGQIGDDFAGK